MAHQGRKHGFYSIGLTLTYQKHNYPNFCMANIYLMTNRPTTPDIQKNKIPAISCNSSFSKTHNILYDKNPEFITNLYQKKKILLKYISLVSVHIYVYV